ncbi:MAG: flavodoxin domain-containing protein [Candidatus Bathyarchaeota archaeon]|nr:flavodoxin domain-containing protein [Candidatus Bathyarchaeota archaeon]
MARVFIIYDSKYGNTKLVAEKIAEGMRELKGMETEVSDVKKVDLKEIDSFDAILIGAPTHFGGPSRTIKKFIDKLGKLKLKAKGVAVFDTFLGEDFEKGVKKMEERLGDKVPPLRLMTSGLSIRVDGMKGPITEGELPKATEFGKKIAASLLSISE